MATRVAVPIVMFQTGDHVCEGAFMASGFQSFGAVRGQSPPVEVRFIEWRNRSFDALKTAELSVKGFIAVAGVLNFHFTAPVAVSGLALTVRADEKVPEPSDALLTKSE